MRMRRKMARILLLVGRHRKTRMKRMKTMRMAGLASMCPLLLQELVAVHPLRNLKWRRL
jgi:hypothetical protein